MENSYCGKLLKVDLTAGHVSEEALNMEYARDFYGGSGLACRYLLDLTDKSTDPLGPDNPLIFMTGPLTGTTAPCCGRYTLCARSPLTGFWGESGSGGNFGPILKFAGYDGIIITGASRKPVYLEINGPNAVIRDASGLWGVDCYQTQEEIKEKMGAKRASVACIGPAGEKKSLISAVVNDRGRVAGRTGMGAVMGSKGLKAVAVTGDSGPAIADMAAFREAAREAHSYLNDDLMAQMFKLGGTAVYVDIGMIYGDIPVKYYTQGDFDVSGLSGSSMAETILTGSSGCYGCPIGCGREVKLEKYGVSRADGPEYETISSLGALLLVDDLEAVAYAGHLCNLYGLDTISTGSAIGFAFYLFERGVISPSETGGIDLRWGDADSVIELINLIARREGFGRFLADGSAALGRHFNAQEDAVHVKGLEVAMHDPRSFSGMAVSYATSPRGGCHLHSDFYMVEIGGERPGLGIFSSPKDRWGESSKEKARTVALHQNWRSVYDALVLCKFAELPENLISRLLSSAAGSDATPGKIIETGERIFNVKRLANLRFGLKPEHDTLPRLLLKPLSEGGAEGRVPDIDGMLEEYYRFREWDTASGAVSGNKLAELGLDDPFLQL
jgi:aldehyde:ferredoxin oxidoreductase